MTVYELIQELSKYPAHTDIKFTTTTKDAEFDLDDVKIDGGVIIIPSDGDIELDYEGVDRQYAHSPVVIKLNAF